MTRGPGSFPARLRAAARLFARPQPVTVPMVALFSIAPGYLVIGVLVSGSTLHSPDSAWDHALPVLPSWSLIYGSLFLAVFLPVFVVHQQDLLRRTILAYLFMWLFAFACFLAYPTRAPPHPAVTGHDFFGAVLRLIYSADVPYNCLPSLHVAQCALAAIVCYRVHRGVGVVTVAWAVLVGLSTLFTKQHYIADVIGGGVLAVVASLAALRGHSREAIPELERRLAPTLALGAFALYGLIVVGLWLAYALGGGSGGLALAPDSGRVHDPAERSVSFLLPDGGPSCTRPVPMARSSSRFIDEWQRSGRDPARA